MRKWFEAQLAAGLPALSGSRVSGTLAVAPALLNEVMAAWLTRPASAESATAPPGLDADALRAFVHTVSVRAEPDRILVDFELRV